MATPTIDAITEHTDNLQQRVNDIFQHHQKIVDILEADRIRLRKDRDYWRQKAVTLETIVSKYSPPAGGHHNSMKT